MEFVHERKVSPREPLADRTFPSLYMYAYIYTHQWHLLCGMIPMVGKPTITWDFDSDPFRGSRFKEYIR